MPVVKQSEPEVKRIAASRIASSRCIVHTFDCRYMDKDAVDVPWTPFSVTLSRASSKLGFFVLSFDTLFDEDGGCSEKQVEFRTDAANKPTHWVQTLLRLSEPLVDVPAGTKVEGEIQIKRNDNNPRELDIAVRGFPAKDSIHFWHMR